MDISSLSDRPEDELLIRMVRVPASQENAGEVAAILRREVNWPAFLGRARQHGVLPLVYRYVKVEDRLPIPGHVIEQLREHYSSNTRRNLMKTGILVRILRRLEQEGIRAIRTRGPHWLPWPTEISAYENSRISICLFGGRI